MPAIESFDGVRQVLADQRIDFKADAKLLTGLLKKFPIDKPPFKSKHGAISGYSSGDLQ
jgi:hypothetical protein